MAKNLGFAVFQTSQEGCHGGSDIEVCVDLPKMVIQALTLAEKHDKIRHKCYHS